MAWIPVAAPREHRLRDELLIGDSSHAAPLQPGYGEEPGPGPQEAPVSWQLLPDEGWAAWDVLVFPLLTSCTTSVWGRPLPTNPSTLTFFTFPGP